MKIKIFNKETGYSFELNLDSNSLSPHFEDDTAKFLSFEIQDFSFLREVTKHKVFMLAIANQSDDWFIDYGKIYQLDLSKMGENYFSNHLKRDSHPELNEKTILKFNIK